MSNKKTKPNHTWALYAATVIFATNTYLFRLAGNAMPSYVFIGVRYVLAGLILKAMARHAKRLTLGAYILIALLAFFGSGIPVVMFVYATTVTPLLHVGFIELLGPIWVLLFATLLHQEKFTSKSLLATGVSMVGAIVMVIPSSSGGEAGSKVSLLGPLLLVTSTMLGAANIVISKKILKKFDAIQFTSLQFLFGGIPFLAHSIFNGEISKVSHLQPTSYLVVFLTITTNGVLPFFLRNIGIRSASLSVAAQQSYLSLAIVALISVVFLGENPTPIAGVGCGIILLGSLLGLPRSALVGLLHHAEYDANLLVKSLRNPKLSLRQLLPRI
jgi:drug/metabolite transporter (DMT)-like permease